VWACAGQARPRSAVCGRVARLLARRGGFEPERLLRLRAEMRLPGLAWLELGVRSDGDLTVYTQRALFHPHGLLGHVYWWVISPFHWVVFGGMKRNIARAAETEA